MPPQHRCLEGAALLWSQVPTTLKSRCGAQSRCSGHTYHQASGALWGTRDPRGKPVAYWLNVTASHLLPIVLLGTDDGDFEVPKPPSSPTAEQEGSELPEAPARKTVGGELQRTLPTCEFVSSCGARIKLRTESLLPAQACGGLWGGG